jgi:hypothetical protein
LAGIFSGKDDEICSGVINIISSRCGDGIAIGMSLKSSFKVRKRKKYWNLDSSIDCFSPGH